MSIRLAAVAAAIGLFTTVAIPVMAQEGKQVELAGGLKYTDTKVGDGEEAKKGYILSMNYTGWLYKNGAKGAQFDSSSKVGKPFTFKLGAGQVIAGWDQGVAGMKVGGKRKLIIPSELGYGKKGAGKVIPADAELTFEVELLKIK